MIQDFAAVCRVRAVSFFPQAFIALMVQGTGWLATVGIPPDARPRSVSIQQPQMPGQPPRLVYLFEHGSFDLIAMGQPIPEQAVNWAQIEVRQEQPPPPNRKERREQEHGKQPLTLVR